MIYLILSVIASSAVSIVMRASEGRAKNTFSMFAANYAVCCLTAFVFALSGGTGEGGSGFSFALWLGALAGVMYLLTLMLMRVNINRSGVTLSSVFMKLGVLIPLACAVIVFKEKPTYAQIIALIIAVAAIFIIYLEPGETASKRAKLGSVALLIALLIGGGMTGAFTQFYEKLGNIAYKNYYMLFVFLFAFILSVIVALLKKEKATSKDILYGALIGLPNYFATRFLLLSLQKIPAVIVYPVYNIGAIVLIGLFGILVFKEKAKGRRLIGYALVIVALVLLNI